MLKPLRAGLRLDTRNVIVMSAGAPPPEKEERRLSFSTLVAVCAPPTARDLKPQQVWLQLYIAVLLGAQGQRYRRQFVDHRHGVAVFGEVHSLDVTSAGIACLHSHVCELSCAVDRELLHCFLAARGTYDSPVSPLGAAHRADQRSLRPISFGPQYTHDRFCGAKGTDRQRFLTRNVAVLIGQVLGFRLLKNHSP